MRQLLFFIILISTYQFSSAQFIEQVYIGESLEKTIELGKQRGHEYLETNGDIASFCVVNELGSARLSIFASPKTKTVWFGTSNYYTENKKQINEKFNLIKQSLYDKYGEPYKTKKKKIYWDIGHCMITLEKKKDYVQNTVISTGAFFKTKDEF
jgi:hypothetical protein